MEKTLKFQNIFQVKGIGYAQLVLMLGKRWHFEPVWEAFKKVPHTCYSTLTDSYKSALNHGCDVAFVCSPPNFHVKQAIDCVKQKKQPNDDGWPALEIALEARQ